jgi:hypothetical protein
MLLNNFKPLIEFFAESTFVNVLGETVYKDTVLGGQQAQGNVIAMGHNYNASVLCYNYNATTGSNSYTDEQTTYNWSGVTNPRIGNVSSGVYDTRYNGFVLFVGTGNTAVTANDYKLDTPVELDVTSASCIHTENNKTYVARTFQNNTGSPVTINEIGCYLFASQMEANLSDNHPIVLIGRRVLQTPVTMANGDMYTFTYIIDMDNVTFS